MTDLPHATMTPQRQVCVQLTETADSDIIKRIPGRAAGTHKRWYIPGTIEAIDQLRATLPMCVIAPSIEKHLVEKSAWEVRVADAREPGGPDKWPYHALDVTPFGHQIRGHSVLTEIASGAPGAGLIHDMGLGKGLTTLAYLATERPDVALVVCPSTVIGVWVGEVEKFVRQTPQTEWFKTWDDVTPMRVWPLTGPVAKRAGKILTLPIDPFDGVTILVTNYESIWRPEMLAALLRAGIKIVVADEAHRLKNAQSKQAKAARQIAAGATKIPLTGTPTDTPGDWYGIYRWLDPLVFGTSETAFRARYFDDFVLPDGRRIPGKLKPEMEDEFYAKAHSLMHVVATKDAIELPEQVFVEDFFPLETKARKMYDELRREAIAFLDSDEDKAIVGQNVLTRRLRMQQITGGFVKDDAGQVHEVSSAKLDRCRTRLESLLTEGRVVVVARFTAEIDAIAEVCAKLGAKVGIIDGRVPPGPKRDEIIRSFQQDDEPRVLLVQPKAGGSGITAHRANAMIVYSVDTSLIDWSQVLKRIHRIGQKNRCRYFLLGAEGTLDVDVYRALRDKEDVSSYGLNKWRDVLAGTGASNG